MVFLLALAPDDAVALGLDLGRDDTELVAQPINRFIGLYLLVTSLRVVIAQCIHQPEQLQIGGIVTRLNN